MSKLTQKDNLVETIRASNFPYYVYELIDPRDMKTFYVGKGKGNRVHEHIKKVERNSAYLSNPKKNEKIKDILNAGLRPIEKIIERFETDEEAVEYEEYTISLYGIENLTNVYKKGLVYVSFDKENKGLAEAKKAIIHISRMLTYFCNPNKHISPLGDFYYDGDKIDAHWLLNKICEIYEDLMNGKFREKLLEVLDKEIDKKHFGASRLI